MDLSSYKKILIIRLSSLGDILLTTPLVRSLKSTFPSLEIDFIIRKEFEDTLRHNPNIENIISLKRDYNANEIQKLIIEKNYDLIIDLQNNLRSRKLTRNLNSIVLRYQKPYINRFLLVNLKINRYKEIKPIPVRYASSIPNFELDNKGLELFVPEGIKSLLNFDSKFIGFCPGSQHETKMWPKGYFVELGNNLARKGYKIVLFGGKSDEQDCKELSNKVKDSIDLSNNNKLLELAVNMKRCKTIICNDSGLMHTALSVDVPVVAIFGSTVKELGFFPYKGRSIVLENNLLSCRPCSHIGLDKCPKKHLKCLKDISPKIVLDKTLKFIEEL